MRSRNLRTSPPVTMSLREIAPHTPGFSAASRIVRQLKDAGHTAFLVGGGVRDLVIGHMPKDFDIVTSARPKEITKLFRRTVAVGAQFGVITVLDEGGPHEVATFRAEGDYADKRRPNWVEFSDLQTDLLRRDFTINGLVLDPDTCDVIDYVGGLNDIAHGIIRTIGDPIARFDEDALRMIRGIRFAARFNFRLARKTRHALTEQSANIQYVAIERVWHELEQILAHPSRVRALRLMRDTHVLDVVLPELASIAYTSRGSWSPWNRTMRRLHALPDETSPAPLFASLLADAVAPTAPPKEQCDSHGAREAANILDRLRAPRVLQKDVSALIERRWVWRDCSHIRLGSIARVLRTKHGESLCMLWHADARSVYQQARLAPIEHVARRLALRCREYGTQPPITGSSLREHGLKPSPLYADLLETAEEHWLEERLETHDAVTHWLDRHIPR